MNKAKVKQKKPEQVIMKKNKTFYLTINHRPLNLVIIPVPKRGYCHRCRLEREIWVISERPVWMLSWEIREFCQTCALNDLTELEESDYQIENKTTLIKEIRANVKKACVISNPI